MINAKISKNTKNLFLNNKHYCAYCGKEILPDIEIDHGDRTEYYHCDCVFALKEIDIQSEIHICQNQIKKFEAKIKKLSEEKDQLKIAYGIRQVIDKID
ncbi:MAG: hypothetical protein [Wendovervirus sonii]|uniref:Uncharacterized protein n=1 Tax=phage Lak_Megaphage_Sonny TaxID=3109229 RepID=A0ABZ0Z2R1_9CAUD|nr:MAG: hypothetical protein [phage Lak_Megaphage_Sonny]